MTLLSGREFRPGEVFGQTLPTVVKYDFKDRESLIPLMLILLSRPEPFLFLPGLFRIL